MRFNVRFLVATLVSLTAIAPGVAAAQQRSDSVPMTLALALLGERVGRPGSGIPQLYVGQEAPFPMLLPPSGAQSTVGGGSNSVATRQSRLA